MTVLKIRTRKDIVNGTRRKYTQRINKGFISKAPIGHPDRVRAGITKLCDNNKENEVNYPNIKSVNNIFLLLLLKNKS